MTEMSKPAETLYWALFDQFNFAKRQQWIITNYVLVLMAALFGLARLASVPVIVKFVLCLLVVSVVVFGLALLVHLQVYLDTTRKRMEHMEEAFSEEDRLLAGWRPPSLTLAVTSPLTLATIQWVGMFDEWLGLHWKPFDFFCAVLCGVVLVAGVVTVLAIAVAKSAASTNSKGLDDSFSSPLRTRRSS